ncbi:MAG: hypothetical protein IJ126_08225 [Lachnospiraceae bacterium]|nr:hypothetical protein [Lachnospiraceae bacterium]
MRIEERVLLRLSAEKPDTAVVEDYAKIITDRLCLRLGVDSLPKTFEGIAADATVKLYRRAYFEGISSEGTEGMTTSFVADILAEYADEIAAYKENKAKTDGDRTIYFL